MASGGRRPGSGKKPALGTELHRSNKEKEIRTETFKALTTTNKLSCPGWLGDSAKKEWRQIMRLYKQMDTKILCDLDVVPLAMYCEAYAIYRSAQFQWVSTIQETTLSTNPEAQNKINECLRTMKEQTLLVNKLADQLCLSPVGRARMGVNLANTKTKNKLLDILGDSD